MTFKEFQALDIRKLSTRAARVFVESDQALYDYVSECKTIEDVNAVLESLAEEPETIRDIMTKYHVTMAELSRRFDIPYRTIQGWAADEGKATARECPKYIIGMIDEILSRD